MNELTKQPDIKLQGEQMDKQLVAKGGAIRLVKGDITDLEIESFVYYAQHDLQLGSGYGTAISIRGGPAIQEELKKLGSIKTTEVVVTDGGNLKAKYIIHAVGPRFQEENTESKLEVTIINVIKEAEAKGISSIAFPAMGAGFYGIPLEMCAKITINTITDYLNGDSKIKDVVICLLDSREYKPFSEYLEARSKSGGK
jgi:O-acetyl-ADP-ribose deacetylase (regulator of RNase III)